MDARWFSKGLLRDAIRHAEHNVVQLFPYVEQGIPVIGVEPSCIATLIDEYPDLLNTDEAHTVANNSYFIEQFVAEQIASGEVDESLFRSPETVETIYVHGHCHQRALIGTEEMMTMLSVLPNHEVELIDSGCCGMAGSFGYETEHYDVSIASGEDRPISLNT